MHIIKTQGGFDQQYGSYLRPDHKCMGVLQLGICSKQWGSEVHGTNWHLNNSSFFSFTTEMVESESIKVQLALEQLGFELCGSTYYMKFFSINTV